METESKTFTVNVSKDLAVSPERAFDAWLQPSMVKHWFAPGLDEMVCVAATHRMDARFADYGELTRQGWATVLDGLAAPLGSPGNLNNPTRSGVMQ